MRHAERYASPLCASQFFDEGKRTPVLMLRICIGDVSLSRRDGGREGKGRGGEEDGRAARRIEIGSLDGDVSGLSVRFRPNASCNVQLIMPIDRARRISAGQRPCMLMCETTCVSPSVSLGRASHERTRVSHARART